MLGLVFLFSISANAQISVLTRANDSYVADAYAQAIVLYERYLVQNNDMEVIEKLADCYWKLRYYPLCEKFYGILVKRKSENPEIILRYAQSLLVNKNPDEAAVWFHKYSELMPDDSRGRDFEMFCLYPPEQLLKQNEISVTPLTINTTTGPEFSAVPFRNGILFCANKTFSRLGIEYVSQATNMAMTDIYYVEKNVTGEWGTPVDLGVEINSKFNEGPVCVSPDGKTIYFTRSGPVPDHIRGARKVTPLFLFSSTIKDGKWSEPKSVTGHPSPHMMGHACVSPDGDFIYFASDKPGGFGGTDLYRAKLRRGMVQEPVNLGPKINSPGNEIFPFVNKNGKLFFSSDGWAGFGGLDIFKSEFTNDEWEIPANIGKPYNSTYDDFSFWADSSEKKGYISSNRNNGGLDDDLFSFTVGEVEFCDCESQIKPDYCFNFKEKRAVGSYPEGTRFQWDFGDGTKREGFETQHCFAKPGTYLVTLNILDAVSLKPVFAEASYEVVIQEIKGLWISMPDTAVTWRTVKFSGGKSTVPDKIIKGYSWDFGDGTKEEGMEPEHIYEKPGDFIVRMMVIAESELTHLPEKFCVKKPIRVLTPEQAGNKTWANLGGGNGPLIVSKTVEKIYERPSGDSLELRVQIGTSLEYIEPLPVNFRGLKNVKAEMDGEMWRYFVGSEKGFSSALSLLKEIKLKGFDDAILISFKQDSLIPNQPSTEAWLPGDASPYITLKGYLFNTKMEPIGGEVMVEEILSGDTVSLVSVNSTTGEFRIRLLKGKQFGYFALVPGYYPASGFVDLRLKGKKIVLSDTLIALSKEEFLGKGDTIRLNNVFFESGEMPILRESWQELFRLARFMRENKSANIEISVHTNNDGDAFDWLVISRRRAAEIEKFLVMVGVEPERLTSIGYGGSKPIYLDKSEESKGANNRVEIRTITSSELARIKPKYDSN